MPLRAGGLAAMLLALALAGCTDGPPRNAPGYDPAQHGTPVDGVIPAEAAVVSGITASRSATAVTLHLGEKEATAPFPAVVLRDARVGGATGTLVLRGATVRLEGSLRWDLGTLALSKDNLTGVLRWTDAGPRATLPPAPAGADAESWRQHSDALFWSHPLELSATGPIRATAATATFAGSEGLRQLGATATFEGGEWRSTAKLQTVEAPAAVTIQQGPGPRMQLALAAPQGVLNLSTSHALALNQATVIDGHGPDLRLEPAPEGVRARIAALRVFQVYHGGEPAIRARVAIEPAQGTVTLTDRQGGLGVRVRETTGEADAVFRAVRTGGAGNVTMPGFLSVWDSWPEDLRLLMLSGPWAVNFVFATVFMEGLRLLTGQYLPQPLQAGQQKDVSVGLQDGTPGGEAWVVLEGRNFDDARLTLRLR